MRMRIADRDVVLLRWVNAMGFVTVKQVASWGAIALSTAYTRIRKLVRSGYLIHERIFHGVPGVYRVSWQGVRLSGSALPALKKMVLATYRHDLLVVDVSLQLVKQHGGYFVTERQLRHESGVETFGRGGHVSDGVLVLADKRIAIEVELSKKSSRRREAIVTHYLKNFDMAEVWYFCGDAEVQRAVEKSIGDASFINVHRLDDLLRGADTVEVGHAS